MSIFEIDLAYDESSFQFTIDLEGEVFVFRFNWNTRAERWYFDILLEDGTALLYGQPVFVSWNILSRFKDIRLPAGNILFFDTTGQGLDPDRFDLGSRVRMLYEESE